MCGDHETLTYFRIKPGALPCPWCVCGREREKERLRETEREGQREMDRKRERKTERDRE